VAAVTVPALRPISPRTLARPIGLLAAMRLAALLRSILVSAVA